MARSSQHATDQHEAGYDVSPACGSRLGHEPAPTTSRRAFLLAAAAVTLGGCSTATRSVRMPSPTWRDRMDLPEPDRPMPGPTDGSSASTGGIIPRSQWALGEPVPARMNRMLPARHITVHHDGMSPFYGGDQSSAEARLEAIRRAHRNLNWGDIGYHYAVDRGGRVYECRPLDFQGAHVKDHNEGNIGIVNLGNFDLQSPSDAQMHALRSLLTSLQQQHRVSVHGVRTHQEWAPTACPGRSMQRYVDALRSSGQLA